MGGSKAKRLNIKLLWEGTAFVILLSAGIFLVAGRIDYWQGWLYTTANVMTYFMTVITLWHHPELIQERLRPGAGWKLWDKIFFGLLIPLFAATLIIGSLDAGRFRWGPALSPSVCIIGFAAYITGQSLFIWSKYTNRFFSSVVRIQKDRGHTVCQEGPYRIVRHPGYVGAIVFLTSMPFILGSMWSLIPTVLLVIAVLARAYLEDEALQKELPGYAEYSEKVRYKLIPHIW